MINYVFLSFVKFYILNLRVMCSHADPFFYHCLVLMLHQLYKA